MRKLKIPFKPQKILNNFLLIALFAGTTGLSANTLRINAGLWSGEQLPSQEGHFFNDDLLSGTFPGRLNLDWGGTDTNVLYPLGVQFFMPLGGGRLVFGLNYFRYAPTYKYAGIGLTTGLASLSLMEIQDYEANNLEFEVGYELKFASDKLLVTPLVGYRSYDESFNYYELNLASGAASISLESPWEATARGLYLGVDLMYKITDTIGLILDYRSDQFLGFLPTFSGDMNHERTIIGNTVLTYSNITAGYKLSVARWGVGVEFEAMPGLRIRGGLRNETLTVSYPDYFDIPIAIVLSSGTVSSLTATTSTIVEYLTDKIFYESEETSTKGSVYLSMSYDIEL